MAPRCFMHIPKCAGMSVHLALVQALPADAIAPKRSDISVLCGLRDLEAVDKVYRDALVTDEDQMLQLTRYAVVSGHFALPRLLRVAHSSSVATVLREPRARLLSHYAYWRLDAEVRRAFPGLAALKVAHGPFREFIAEPSVAPITDNLICRMLLGEHPLIPAGDFIAACDIPAVVAQATEALDTLGAVALLERADAMWRVFSDFFGIVLSPSRVNVTGSVPGGPDLPAADLDVTTTTVQLIEARTAADSAVYRHALLRSGSSVEEAEQRCEAAFASELIRLGDLTGESAVAARRTRRELERVEADLERHRAWLSGLQGSASWRLTAPARALKRRVRHA